ncbi:hypothetical protein Tco_1339658 [Tanacetum coccineum]
MVPRKILTRSGPISLNTARQSHLNAVCCCCSRHVNTARPKAVVNAVRTNQVNAVKASACWVWMPKNRVIDHVSKNISASVTLKRLDYIDAQGKFKLKDQEDEVFESILSIPEQKVKFKNFFKRYSYRLKDQEDEVFGSILSK